MLECSLKLSGFMGDILIHIDWSVMTWASTTIGLIGLDGILTEPGVEGDMTTATIIYYAQLPSHYNLKILAQITTSYPLSPCSKFHW